jgi:predicted nucleic acid-binding protein
MSSGTTLVDTNVLLDILTADAQWLAWSSSELRKAKLRGVVTVNPIICAEVAPAFDFDWARLDAWLAQAGFLKEPLPFEASTIAAAAHRAYRLRGGSRDTPLPDFYIGAHAEVAGHQLLSRDDARYSSYFSKVTLIAPKG